MYLNLKAIRDARHMNQQRVASLVPMSIGNYRKYEKNTIVNYNKNILQRLCIVLDCSIDQLLIVERF